VFQANVASAGSGDAPVLLLLAFPRTAGFSGRKASLTLFDK
jgi:hypothetical protein